MPIQCVPKKGNTSSKVSHIKNTCLILMICLLKYEVTHQLSFDTLFASTLSRVTEVGSIEGEGYKTYFFQVFGFFSGTAVKVKTGQQL